MEIGKRIIKYRKEENLSQEALADKLGISRQTLSNYENDITVPDLEMASKIALMLNTSIDDLTGNSKDALFNKINNTEKIVRKQTKYIKIVGITIYLVILIGIIAIGIYFALNKDFSSDFQDEYNCYNNKTNEKVTFFIMGYPVPIKEYYEDFDKDNNQVAVEHYYISASFYGSKNYESCEFAAGRSLYEVEQSIKSFKRNLIAQGFTCK